ncbi:MAG: hypothetical protein Q4F72_05865 [Desulfovibrionaceae bacterium]|nr:hypothetical protein [Desulfovibrionaceae bacterium]
MTLRKTALAVFCLLCLAILVSAFAAPAWCAPDRFGDSISGNIRLFTQEKPWKGLLKKCMDLRVREGQLEAYSRLSEDFKNKILGRSVREISVSQLRETFALAAELTLDYTVAEMAKDPSGKEFRFHIEGTMSAHEQNWKDFLNPKIVIRIIKSIVGMTDREMDQFLYDRLLGIYGRVLQGL